MYALGLHLLHAKRDMKRFQLAPIIAMSIMVRSCRRARMSCRDQSEGIVEEKDVDIVECKST